MQSAVAGAVAVPRLQNDHEPPDGVGGNSEALGIDRCEAELIDELEDAGSVSRWRWQAKTRKKGRTVGKKYEIVATPTLTVQPALVRHCGDTDEKGRDAQLA